jgi:hypothetical protein
MDPMWIEVKAERSTGFSPPSLTNNSRPAMGIGRDGCSEIGFRLVIHLDPVLRFELRLDFRRAAVKVFITCFRIVVRVSSLEGSFGFCITNLNLLSSRLAIFSISYMLKMMITVLQHSLSK